MFYYNIKYIIFAEQATLLVDWVLLVVERVLTALALWIRQLSNYNRHVLHT